jgi:threonine/homoserine/homoserine lactone efflux protein
MGATQGGGRMRDALVLAVGVAVSPVPIAAVTLVRTGARPLTAGSSFALGWVLGVTVAIILLIALVGLADTSEESPLWIAVPELVLGLVFLALAAHIWRGRNRRKTGDAPPWWLDALDRLTPARSASLGFVLAAANPKNLGLALAAAIALTEAEAGSAATVSTAVLFVAIGTTGVAAPLALSAAAPARSRSALRRLRALLLEYDAPVLTLLGLAIGAKLVYDGFTAL